MLYIEAVDRLILAVIVIVVEFRHVVGKTYSRSKYEKASFPMLFESGICSVGNVKILAVIPLQLELQHTLIGNQKT